MDSENKQILTLVVMSSFFFSLPFLMKNKSHAFEKSKSNKEIVKTKPKVKIKKRLPASKSPYSVKDFEAKNLLNKKILTKKQYDEALEASKHVGISYVLPDPRLDYKLTKKDMAPVRKVQRAVHIAQKQKKATDESINSAAFNKK